VIYTLSRRQPRDDSGFWQIDEPRPFAPALTPGQPLDFILRANPVRRSMRNPSETVRGRMERRAGKHSNSSDQKHDVVMLEKRRLQEAGLPALDEPELVQSQGEAWLRQQEKSSGFEVVRVRADGYQQQRIFRRGAPASFSTIEFSGLLRVTDPAQMKQRLWFGTEGPAEARVSPGLGSARGFGCGLMLVRRPAAPWAGGADDEDDG